MYGVVPNWNYIDKNGQKRSKITKEKVIVDNLIKSIGKSVNIQENSNEGDDDKMDSDAEYEFDQDNKKKKQSKNCCARLFKGSNGNVQRSCQDRLIISDESAIYQFWKIMVIMICIISSYIYAYITAFRIPEQGSSMAILDIVFDIIFAMDMCVRK